MHTVSETTATVEAARSNGPVHIPGPDLIDSLTKRAVNIFLKKRAVNSCAQLQPFKKIKNVARNFIGRYRVARIYIFLRESLLGTLLNFK